jgi:hypothetical protein
VVGLRLAPERQAAVDGLEPELRAAAAALGSGLGPELARRAPGLARAAEGGGEPDALLVELALDREPEPDALTLAACAAAHRAYVTARERPDGVSLGALALARLLVWASRAAILGAVPKVVWLGPPSRRPEPGDDRIALEARCVCEIAGARREARAAALIARPTPSS